MEFPLRPRDIFDELDELDPIGEVDFVDRITAELPQRASAWIVVYVTNA